jgi:AraC-like DNA-binding protein
MAERSNLGWLALADRVLAARTPPAFPLWGRVTVETGWSTGERRLQLHLFYLVTRHAMRGEVAGKAITLSSGDAIWIPPGCPHTLDLPAGAPRFSVYYVRVSIPHTPRARLAPLMATQVGDLVPTVDELYDELRSRTHGSATLQRSLLAQILIGVVRGSDRTSASTGLTAPQRQAVMSYAEQHIADRPTAADLAATVDLSPDYFTRVFRRTFGRSPRAWLMRERMRRAADELVETSRSIKSVAYSLGYADLYLFSRQFRAAMGKSPRSYRRSASG